MRSLLHRFSPSRVTGGAAIAPLLILFGLNAADELDRTAFGLLAPEIRDHFGLDNQGIFSIIAVVGALSYGAQPLIGYLADRMPRIRLAVIGAGLWAVFSFLTGLSPFVWLLVIARVGSAIGRLVNDPTHNSLLADYYEPDRRIGVYGFHRAANAVGQIFGPLIAGVLAYSFGFRAPFLVFALPTVALIVLALVKLREPVRGGHERRLMGASDEVIATEEVAPSFAEGWRTCNQVQSLRRIWLSLPFLAAALIGLTALTSILYEDVHGLDERQRGVLLAVVEPFQLVGILLGIPIAMRLFARRPSLVMQFLAVTGTIVAAALVGLALAPNLPIAVAMNVISQGALGVLGPGIYAVLSLAIPPRARALGFSIGALYVIPGFLILVIIGGLADEVGIRGGIVMLAPVLLLGAFIIASSGRFVEADIAKVRASALAQAEVLAARRRGESKLLLVKDLDAGYDGVQILFGVDFEVDEGEIIALLGTNGAGKSTLLRVISGLLPATAGAVVFDGQDMTYAPPQEIAGRGVVQVPGGKGVFPALTVEENLKIAGWLYRKDQAYLAAATEQVLEYFPVLRDRWDQPAGNLSGGEQQMLTLGQAFIAQPRLLMIDELSLGLAPIIVEQLLEIVRAIRERGTTIILVEQSVNVALTVAETAYFLEKGEIRFKGPTAELLERPDVLRSVFLEGAAAAEQTVAGGPARTRQRQQQAALEVLERPVVLEARGLSKRYGGIAANSDITFELHEGEILGFIGPNGAGKTTLFDLLSGFVLPDTGTLRLDGEDITDLPADARARLGLGRSFQDARLFPALTVRDTIAIALERAVQVRDPVAAFLRLPAIVESERAIRERVEELIELMGLEAFADKFVSELSTGSRRIVDLACVIAHDPKVILFDEPASGIAQKETEALGPLLQRIRQQTGASLVVIEHDMPLITGISDRIVALDLGSIVTVGAPQDVVEDPRVIASYLGSSEEAIARSGSGGSGRARTRRSGTGRRAAATTGGER